MEQITNIPCFNELLEKSILDNWNADALTDFKGQKLELETGPWEATDFGVADGDLVACSHPIMPVERLVNIDTGVEKLRLAFRVYARARFSSMVMFGAVPRSGFWYRQPMFSARR